MPHPLWTQLCFSNGFIFHCHKLMREWREWISLSKPSKAFYVSPMLNGYEKVGFRLDSSNYTSYTQQTSRYSNLSLSGRFTTYRFFSVTLRIHWLFIQIFQTFHSYALFSRGFPSPLFLSIGFIFQISNLARLRARPYFYRSGWVCCFSIQIVPTPFNGYST